MHRHVSGGDFHSGHAERIRLRIAQMPAQNNFDHVPRGRRHARAFEHDQIKQSIVGLGVRRDANERAVHLNIACERENHALANAFIARP